MARFHPAQYRRRQYQDQAIQDVQDAIRRSERGFYEYAHGTPVIKYEDYHAKYGEHVFLHPTSSGLTVHLPGISIDDIGRDITVTNATSQASAVTVSVSDGSTIEGYNTYTAIGPYETASFQVSDRDLFTVV